jgi:hypothetical protein
MTPLEAHFLAQFLSKKNSVPLAILVVLEAVGDVWVVGFHQFWSITRPKPTY